MSYEIFTRKKTRISSPSISINTMARIGLNQAATNIMVQNAVEFILLLWDKEHHKMAIRAIRKPDSRAYTLSKAKGSSMFSAKSFLEHIGYDFSEHRNFLAEWNAEENMFEVELPIEHFRKQAQPALAAIGGLSLGKAKTRSS